eukprot:TRINITY_DN283_c0_g3_i2.p1 TRINITY_DN283_c0_g3~~TRINITY_DN283_c0_g3_i2.p1  ORF type:complete len:208 (-),score=30.60 TRINITY_DN283_c0_g3_i2:80-703(-)
MIHAILICPLAWYTATTPELTADKVYGDNYAWYTCASIAGGYFAWDLGVTCLHLSTWGFGALIHAAACLAVYTIALSPIFAYYGTFFLLWEASTPFLNMRWFLLQYGMKDTPIYFWNGLLLVLSFFIVRICLGLLVSYDFHTTSYELFLKGDLPWQTIVVLSIANVVLNSLNIYWLSLIHISEPTRLLSISYAVFCLKKKKKKPNIH